MGKPLYLRAFELYLDGYSYREIAKIIYGAERYYYRVKRLIHHARLSMGESPLSLLEKYPQVVDEKHKKIVNELLNSKNILEYKKKHKRDPLAVQLATHEQLIYFVLKKLGFRINDPVFSTAKHYHYKLFPMIYKEYGKRLRCWRNSSKSTRLFSATFESLAYVYGLVLSVLLLFGYNKRYELDQIFRSLIPDRKKIYAYKFYALYPEIVGKIMPHIISPTI